MTDLPEPLVPAEVDLRDFPFTPMFRARLFGSSFHARATDAEWRAGVTLWLKSWDQVPAGTLPDDDVDLCRLAELGRDLKAWRRIRERALHGWRKCSDNRLHHAVVAEGVLEAWERRSKASKKGKAGASARWGTGNTTATPTPIPKLPRDDSSGIARAMPSDGKGQGQGQGQGEDRPDARARATPRCPPDNPAAPAGQNGESEPDPLGIPLALDRSEEAEAVRRWNAIAERIGTSAAQVLSQTRRKKLTARLRECGGLDGWNIALGKVAASSFLCGGGERGWRADLDFLLQQKSFTKLMEGGYDDRGSSSRGRAQPSVSEVVDRIVAEHAEDVP